MRTVSEQKATDLRQHRKSYKLQLHIWLEPRNFPFLGRWARISRLSSFGLLGIMCGGRHPRRSFQVSSRVVNPVFLWCPRDFMLRGPENPQSLENQNCPKNSSKGNAMESTARCNHSFKNGNLSSTPSYSTCGLLPV